MIVCENRALSECIRDGCKTTGTGRVLRIAAQIEFTFNVLFLYPFAVLLL